ncbi:LytTR family DNA-binding domain-containing protein [Undibacterium cyanobacteriorum]|uniref:LytTR family DNA-binding domain-containing protein n=1 Tax=Undibacterium cyanobacteriorum TaxID=3073561 RepID=A0ABY9RHI3_9BURK|nr:LytTR family DNA-binding domain-containing protein [Undibacterium sp. 20NA77.5]WMW80678.1 LytTR family DNA-binding domain-containing protein [Undibacterium sp. 20NA77.5]
MKKFTALIVDDEAHLRQHLRHRLLQVWPELEVIGEAANASTAQQLYLEHPVDIVFLDIRMPGQSGIEIATHFIEKSIVVFVTAYDSYAIEAFEKGAVDYLLKPIEKDRLSHCCKRLQERLSLGSNSSLVSNHLNDIKNCLVQLGSSQEISSKKYLRWIQAGVGNGIRLISTSEILYFRSDEKYTSVRTEQSEYLIRKTLKELEDELDPHEFWRVHRSALVKVGAISSVLRDEKGKQVLSIRGIQEKIEVSRNHTHLFQQM